MSGVVRTVQVLLEIPGLLGTEIIEVDCYEDLNDDQVMTLAREHVVKKLGAMVRTWVVSTT